MIAKRILEFLSHKANFLQGSNFPYSILSQIQSFASLESVEQPVRNKKFKKNEEYRENDEESEREKKYNNQKSRQFNWILPTAAVLLSSIYSNVENKKDNPECFFRSRSDKLEPNKLKNRVSFVQYAANKPLEDRYHTKQLENLDGYVVSVFDGHGGWQVAELAMIHLADDLDSLLKANKGKYKDTDEYISESLKQAFDKVENRYLEIAREAYEVGFPNVGRIGACALVSLIHNKKLYVANAGDCKGVMCSLNNKGEVVLTKLNQKFNANSKKEQKRLKSEFKDSDIYICRRRGACYVKNVLQPTRALGDPELKYPEFNNPNNYGMDRGYHLPIQNYNGPYITHKPDIKIFDIKPEDRYIILSSDGMWDELEKQTVSKVVKANISDKINIANSLLKQSLNAIGKRNNMSEGELSRIPLGQRRRIHDDITIAVLNLQEQ